MAEIIKIKEKYMIGDNFYSIYRVKSEKSKIDGIYIFQKGYYSSLDIKGWVKEFDMYETNEDSLVRLRSTIRGVAIIEKSDLVPNILKEFEREYKLNLLLE